MGGVYMVKRRLCLLLSLLILLSSGACRTVETPLEEASGLNASSKIVVATHEEGEAFDPAAPEGEKYKNLDFGAEGDKLYSMVVADFWDGTLGKAYEYLDDRSQTAFVWPYGSFLQMQGAYLDLHPEDGEAADRYKAALTALDTRYMCIRTDGLLSYSSSYDKVGGDVYYDDNAWLALEFCDAYDRFGDAAYLEKAKGLAEYLYSGWDEEIGGGIWWKEGLKEDKNGFTNSPVVILSVWLYEKTGEGAYLDWAKKIYAWVRDYLRTENGLIADSIDTAFAVNRTFFTYTTGTAIGAATELYRVTGEQRYLDDAVTSAAAAFDAFGVYDEEEGAYVFGVDFPNWHGWLLDGFMRLYPFAPEAAELGLRMFEYALGRACGRARYDNGYFIVDWNSTRSDKQIDLLHQAGTARCLLNIQNFRNRIGEE